MDRQEPKTKVEDERKRDWFWDVNAIFDDPELSAYAKLVRFCLARFAGADRHSWPSLTRISEMCGISRKTVIRAIQQLEAKKWIKREVRKMPDRAFDTTVYTLYPVPQEDEDRKEGSCEKGLEGSEAGRDCETPGVPSDTGSVPQTLRRDSQTPGGVLQSLGSVQQTLPRDSQSRGWCTAVPGVGSVVHPNHTKRTIPGEQETIDQDLDLDRVVDRIDREIYPRSFSSPSFSDEKEGEETFALFYLQPGVKAPASSDDPPPERRNESPINTGGEKDSPSRHKGTDPGREGRNAGGKEKSPSLQSGKAPVTNGELIAELADKLHGIEGIEPLKGHYQLVGKAYREYGYDVVCEAIDDLEIEIIAKRRFGEPFSERDLWAMLLAKCRWVSKPKPKPEEKKEEAEEKDPWGPSVPFWDLYEKTPDGRIVAKFDGIPPGVEIVGDVAVVRKRVDS